MRVHPAILHVFGGGLLALTTPAAALVQCRPVFIPYLAHHRPPSPADTIPHTEQNNRGGFWLGPALVRDDLFRARIGLEAEGLGFVAPRWQLGGRALVVFPRAAPTNFGRAATAPALTQFTVAATARYQLFNTRRWRLDALGGVGAGIAQLTDRDRLVPVRTRYGTQEQPATVAVAARPLAETGLGLSFKLGREVWLGAALRYARTLGPAPLGAPALAGQWQGTLGLVMPSGFAVRQPAAAR